MVAAPTRDFFDRARGWAVAVMLAAGAAAVIGSMLEWVTITVRPELQPGSRFEDAERVVEPEISEPYTGLEARDGWWSLAGGIVLMIAGVALSTRKRAAWGWLGVLGAMTIGAVAIADYRGIGNLSSSISHRLDIVGGAEPGVGLTLVVAAGIAGLIGSAAGIAASPRR
jgi:LPXTG-motif cell wall-anchored protein